MAFHWRCYKFICHNLLYAPLLAYLYMPSRGHTHRSSLSLSLSLRPREPTELWLSRGEGGGGGGGGRWKRAWSRTTTGLQNAERRSIILPSPSLPRFFERDTSFLPSSFQGNNVFQLLLYYACYEVILSSVIESWKGRFDREITIG